MTDISYSNDALNVRSNFFGVRSIVYVEGDDDVLFWREIFSKVTDEPFEVESVGGAPNLDEYIVKITAGQLQAIAARDADFLSLLGRCLPDPRIVYTYGYSIENSLYTASVLTELVRLWCKSHQVDAAACTQWLNDFALTVKPLVILDLANAMSASGVATVGDNCSRYMRSDNSEVICTKKVEAAVKSIENRIPTTAVDSISNSIGNNPEMVIKHIRGHFLATAARRYIVKKAKDFGRKASISGESLYAAAITLFGRQLNETHLHRGHYLDSAKLAWEACS